MTFGHAVPSAVMSNDASPIGIIAGTGFYALAQLDDAVTVTVDTAYGPAAFTRGRWHGVEVIFLTRHGAGHSVPPHLVNYRANIQALRDAGVRDVFAINVVGGVDPHWFRVRWCALMISSISPRTVSSHSTMAPVPKAWCTSM